MDAKEFRKRGQEMVDYIADYFESVSKREVIPKVKPGYLFPLLPSAAPEKGESFENIMLDFEKYIMPGILHWQHPRFHSYFPANSSYPSILGETISNTFGCTSYNLGISLSEKELEFIILNWYGKMMGLPDEFLHNGGGGLLGNTCSDCTLLSLFAARNEIFKKLHNENTYVNPISLLPSLVAYCSIEAHCSVEKAAMIAMVSIKVLDTDENCRLRGETLAEEVEKDIKNGLIPFYVCLTVGTTSCCACDPIYEMGPICESHGIWLHVDASYGGNFLICPEYRHFLKGIEYASSFVVNPVKMMMMNFDGAAIFTRCRSKLVNAFSFESDLFPYGLEKTCHLPVQRFRALKLWCIFRNYGVERLQAWVRKHISLAKMFEKYVRDNERFELLSSNLGLVCFRLRGSNMLNKKLWMEINESGKLSITPCNIGKKYVLRFCVCYPSSTEKDVTYAWSVITDFAGKSLVDGNEIL